MDQNALDRLTAILALRAMVKPKNFNRFLRNSPFDDEGILKIVGIETIIDKSYVVTQINEPFVQMEH